MSGREITFRSWLCKFVPWAKQLAIVAAVHPVSDQFAKLNRNFVLEFDRQV
jgi:hypothetical protein